MLTLLFSNIKQASFSFLFPNLQAFLANYDQTFAHVTKWAYLRPKNTKILTLQFSNFKTNNLWMEWIKIASVEKLCWKLHTFLWHNLLWCLTDETLTTALTSCDWNDRILGSKGAVPNNFYHCSDLLGWLGVRSCSFLEDSLKCPTGEIWPCVQNSNFAPIFLK